MELLDSGRISKSSLLRAAKKNPDSIMRLAKYLRLYTTAYSADQTARLLNWLFKKDLLNRER